MEYLGLLFEIIFLCFGVYLYLFVRGVIKQKDEKMEAHADEFRKKNGWWLRALSIALVAVMLVEIGLHLKDLLA